MQTAADQDASDVQDKPVVANAPEVSFSTTITGLLEEVHHSLTKYATTQKGLKFIEKWRELIEFL